MKPLFIFSDRRPHRLQRHLVFWGAYILFSTFIYGYKSFSHGTAKALASTFLEAVTFTSIHLLFSYFILYFLIPRYIFRGRYTASLALLLASMLVIGSLSWVLSVTAVPLIRGWFGLPCTINGYMYGLMAGLRGGITIAGFAAAIKLMKMWYLARNRAEEAEKLRLRAELRLLKAQVHPHFLFNTLNNIYAFALRNDREVPGMIMQLSGMLRYMLYEADAVTVPLRKEIELIRHYIELEQLRYEELDLSVSIQGATGDRVIAPLLLLPFVENSFKHTASGTASPWISLRLEVVGDELVMELSNSKDGEKDSGAACGIGLQNVQQRLELLYAGRHQLTVTDRTGVYTVLLRLQLQPGRTAPVKPVKPARYAQLEMPDR